MTFSLTRLARRLLYRGPGLSRYGRGLLAGLLLVGHAACLIPQDDPILDPLPPTRNRPPRILENLVKPQRSFPPTTIRTGPGCPASELFEVLVADPDIDDAITVRWYVDYDPVNNPSPFGLENRLVPSGKEVRDRPGELQISTQVGPLTIEGLHLIEAFVTDGILVNRDPQPREVSPDGGVLNPSYLDTFAWYVNVVSEVCP